jgi:hypothetical protein
MHGPQRGAPAVSSEDEPAPDESPGVAPRGYRRKPTAEEFATALQAAHTLHVTARDPRFLGKAMLYLDQRRQYLEKVLELADQFLVKGQEAEVHSFLLKAIHAAKRAEEHATGKARVPFLID